MNIQKPFSDKLIMPDDEYTIIDTIPVHRGGDFPDLIAIAISRDKKVLIAKKTIAPGPYPYFNVDEIATLSRGGAYNLADALMKALRTSNAGIVEA